MRDRRTRRDIGFEESVEQTVQFYAASAELVGGTIEIGNLDDLRRAQASVAVRSRTRLTMDDAVPLFDEPPKLLSGCLEFFALARFRHIPGEINETLGDFAGREPLG